MITDIDAALLEKIADLTGKPVGAFNIRKDSGCEARQSTEHIAIDPRSDGKSGIDIRIKPGTKGEKCYIPVIISHSGLSELVYNDFYLGENSTMQMETIQIRGIDSTKRETDFFCEAGSEVVVTERLLTHGAQEAESDMRIELNGHDARGRVISRSVAQDRSHQIFHPVMVGNAQCFGHVQCDSIIMGDARIESVPAITANCPDAQLIHEAAIGKIAGDQLLKLETLGLTPEQAEETILTGFLA